MDASIERATTFWRIFLQGIKTKKTHSYIIKNSNLTKVGTNENPAMVAASILILAFLNVWEFYLKP